MEKRQILFRGFVEKENGNETIKINNKEVKGYWAYWNEWGAILCSYSHKDLWQYNNIMELINEAIPATFAQYTGLTDVNGTPIFEGDIGKVITLDTKETRYFEVSIGEFTDCNADDDLYVGVYLKCDDGNAISGGQLKQYEGAFEVVDNIYANFKTYDEE